jgi:DEAD/DEAH box helicase
VNLRTSAGKTRIAELAILQTLLAEPSAQVFYLAPFRSLAFEIEHTLGGTFNWLGYAVSHLYGGSRVSSVDTELASESNITIATPEKARALFRAAPELFERMKLLVIDEGHLIGPEERFIRNEVFVDHLRSLVERTGARILLLSAVLPNPQELAEWITGDSTAVASSSWKPSVERFGLLRWNGSRVRIEWQGEVPSFNPSFVEAKRLNFGRRRRAFPKDKNEAVAATAVRLSAIGPVMIFTGRAVSVPTLAAGVLLALGEVPANYRWPEHEWKVFEAVCQEELEPDAIELRAARAGVICHSNRLTSQVRLALEHLMQSQPPKIIIATTTLAQGVNVGISAVIIATPYIGQQKTIDKRDFWNICGRAGRAFVDGEGKILYAIDDTGEPWQIRRDLGLARSYFDADVSDPVQSGLLLAVRALRRVASEVGVAFDVLLELAANNDFSRLGNAGPSCEKVCDLLDDELLALHIDPIVNPAAEEPTTWVERVFRQSLAAIQARLMPSDISPDDVFAFLRARVNSALIRSDDTTRRLIVSSGLPFSVALRAHGNLNVFAEWADDYVAAMESLVDVVRNMEEWARLNATAIGRIPASTKLDSIREGWLAGLGLQSLIELEEDAKEITREFYGYHLPWIIHAASQQLRGTGQTEQADTLAKISLMLELGVPSELAAQIFLAGVRSRRAATELAALDDIRFSSNLVEISRTLRDSQFVNEILSRVSDGTAHWLNLLVEDTTRGKAERLVDFPTFMVPGAANIDILYARRLDNQIVLSTIDGRTRFSVQATRELPFDLVANDPRVAFVRSGEGWRLVVRDPRVAIS